MNKYLSVIIPAYNEEKLIGISLSKFVSFLGKKKFSWEIIVVDDGSADKTSGIVKSFKNPNISLIRLEKNQGKGGALKAGFLGACGKYQIFSDADLSVAIETITPFLNELKNFDVVIASRRVKGAEIKLHQSWLRENMGRVFTTLTQILTGSKIADFTCGFKGFTQAAAQEIFGHSLISRWAYDAEIIFLAEKFGLKILQYPVTWKNRKDTRVVLGRVVFESLRDLIKIRINDLRGKYERNIKKDN
jgi:dolichyl-phosphate beta-glucosyltransferase